jgi:hypothetical protein
MKPCPKDPSCPLMSLIDLAKDEGIVVDSNVLTDEVVLSTEDGQVKLRRHLACLFLWSSLRQAADGFSFCRVHLRNRLTLLRESSSSDACSHQAA